MSIATIPSELNSGDPHAGPAFPFRLRSCGLELNHSSGALGWLRDSSHLLNDVPALRSRIAEEGYLLLRQCLNREQVLSARGELTRRLAEAGSLEPDTPLMDAMARKGVDMAFRPDLALHNPPLTKLLYDGPMIDFYRRFLGAEVRHFDFTWLRAVAPGHGTQPHCDIVYMGRGTPRLYTSWTPIGDVSLQAGGLMILENSHKNQRLQMGYGRKDVDAYCTNKRAAAPQGLGGGGNIRAGGALSDNPVKLRDRLGGRWLTTEFSAGDLLIFPMYTVHASLDNQSATIRLSTDTRYQLASEAVDERWIGENPIGHGPAAKRGFIC